jgi:hypothetical protein
METCTPGFLGRGCTFNKRTAGRAAWLVTRKRQCNALLEPSQEFFFFFEGCVCFWKVIFKKLFLKFFRVCLLLRKLVNGIHFPINEKHFPVK